MCHLLRAVKDILILWMHFSYALSFLMCAHLAKHFLSLFFYIFFLCGVAQLAFQIMSSRPIQRHYGQAVVSHIWSLKSAQKDHCEIGHQHQKHCDSVLIVKFYKSYLIFSAMFPLPCTCSECIKRTVYPFDFWVTFFITSLHDKTARTTVSFNSRRNNNIETLLV